MRHGITRHIFQFTSILLIVFTTASCRKDLGKDGSTVPCGTGASLSISVSLPEISLGTKASPMPSKIDGDIVSDPFGENVDKWNDLEKLIDGRMLYRVTVLILSKETGELAGYRDIYEGCGEIKGSSDTRYGANGFKVGNVVKDTKYAPEAVINFNYDSPLHTITAGDDGATFLSPEQLDRGAYRLIVIANWSAVDIDYTVDGESHTQNYTGLKNSAGETLIGGYVEGIKKEFLAQTPGSRKKFSDYADYHNLMDFTIASDSEEFLCPLAPQPLVLVKDIVLNPGDNKVSAQLKRTWARVRVSVENISDKELTVHSLSFGDNTTKDESYLFFAPGNDAATLAKPNTSTKYGAPKIESGSALQGYNALIAFTPETKVDPIDTTKTVQTNRTVLFDGYILDSDGKGNDGTGTLFSYSLDLEYEGKKTVHLRRAKKADGKWDIIEDNIDGIEDGGLYVLQSRRIGTKVVLYAGDSTLETNRDMANNSTYIKDEITEFQEEYVFRLVRDTDIPEQEVNKRKGGKEISPVEKVPFPRYWIQTYDRKYWLGTPTYLKQKIKLLPQSPTAFIARNDGFFKTWSGSNILFLSTVEDPNRKGTYEYLNVNGGDSEYVQGWYEDDDGSQFHLTKVNETIEDARFTGAVTLATMDPETAVSKQLSCIRRNDFINIYVTASYSDNAGEFNFTVKDWEQKDFDIEFE